MVDFFKKLPEQAVRVIVVFLVLAVVLLVIRQFIIPPEIKDPAVQKLSSTQREAAKGIKYAGAEVCAQCHDKEPEIKKIGYHRDLSCESCHGASQKHVDNPTEVKPTSPKKRDYCVYCHQYNASRPTGFPQINPDTHNPRKPCISCHNPHNPKPPTTPHSCNACHAQIERAKAASYHALIECTVCHSTPDKHKTSPRTVLPTKPDKREFCGQCHDKASPRKGVPTVDMNAHGEKYVCWQCHYPHTLGGI
ncbi:MAG: cytochrome c3 family protein [Syntrophales bacterium]|jgi:predicted CXXCH cytochrome family protein|nr:cytochrome c3 family protein [Syntrophales bacterium]